MKIIKIVKIALTEIPLFFMPMLALAKSPMDTTPMLWVVRS
jgi:hypothetical protein